MGKCFVDLDGVLADFVRGSFKFHNKSIPWSEIQWDYDKQLGLTPEEFWAPLDEDFWAGLDRTYEFYGTMATVYEHFKINDVFLLSSPCNRSGCITGKARWIEKYLPELSRRTLLTNEKAMLGCIPGAVLIDDSDKNCQGFIANGGQAFIFPRPWNINRLLENQALHELWRFLKGLKTNANQSE